MKNITLKFLHVGALLAVASFAAAQTPGTAPGADPAPPPTPDEIGYKLGLSFGAKLHGAGITNEVSVDAVARGVKDALGGKTPSPTDQQQIVGFVRGVHDKQVARNEAANKSFLERNGKDKNVVTTASGLQYRINAPGDKKGSIKKERAPRTGPSRCFTSCPALPGWAGPMGQAWIRSPPNRSREVRR